jgi:hypothetical protein
MIWLGFILNAILAYLAFHVTIHPVDEERDKVKILLFKAVIIVCILGSGLTTYYQSKESERQEIEFGNRIDAVKINLRQDFQKRTDKIITEQLVLQLGQQALISELATNQSITPEMRQRIIESNSQFQELDSNVGDFAVWRSKFRNKQMSIQLQQQIDESNKLKNEQVFFDKSSPFYDGVVKLFEDMMKKVATSKGDKAFSNYHGIPNAVDFDSSETIIGEIKLERNVNWDFKICLTENFKHLIINFKGGYANFSPDLGISLFNSEVHIANLDTVSESHPIQDYKTTITNSLQYVIGFLANQPDSTNKSASQ